MGGLRRCLAGVGGEWRRRAGDGGSGVGRWRRQRTEISDEEEGEKKSTTGIGASLTPDSGTKRRVAKHFRQLSPWTQMCVVYTGNTTAVAESALNTWHSDKYTQPRRTGITDFR